MKLTSAPLALIILFVLFGSIGLTSALNLWQTESNKVPAVYAEGEAAGQYNPADIRGSYTFGEVSELFDIPLADLQSAFRIPADANPAAYPLKSLEDQFAGLPVEIGTGSVRLFTAFYKGLPYPIDPQDDTYLLPEAAVILQKQGKLRPEQAEYLGSHIVPADGATAPAAVTTPAPAADAAPAATEHTAPERTVTGKTTFQDLLDWGVPQEKIEEILGSPLPDPAMIVKDYVNAQGLEFSSLKGALQAEIP